MLIVEMLVLLSLQNIYATGKESSDYYRIFRPKEFNAEKPLTGCHSNATLKKLPGALIVGVKKSGTYALLRYLSVNPQIKAALKINNCELNEIHFFDQDVNYYKGLEWYKSKMPSVCLNARVNGRHIKHDDVTVIEKTPGYFRSSIALERIYSYNPRTKIILIVRDPVRRIQSELTHCATRQKKLKVDQKCQNANRIFEQLFGLRLNASRLSQELEKNKFVRNSIYYLDMIKWVTTFGTQNVFVVNGENFIKTPWVELNKLEQFLNVSKLIHKRHFHFDRKKNFFCLKEPIAAVRPKASGNASAETSNLEYDGCLGKNKGRKSHVFLSEFVKNELRKYFHEWNKLFFKLIGKNFDW